MKPMFYRLTIAAAVATLAIPAHAPRAQIIDLTGPGNPSVDDLAAYSSLLQTPAGAFAPLFTSTMAGVPANSTRLALRYGHVGIGNVDFHNLAATVLLPASTNATVQLTAGFIHPSCDNCDNQLMLSIGGDLNLYSSPLGPNSGDGRFTVGLNGELGYGKPRDESLVSGIIGLPFALPLGSGPMKIAPYVTPAFGFGRVSSGGTDASGSRFLLGGGVGLFNPQSSVSVSAGFQNIFIDGGKMVFGLALSFGS